jgi:hypothetical protein
LSVDNINLSESLKAIDNLLTAADKLLEEYPSLGVRDQYDIPEMQVEYCIENAFIQTLVLIDRLDLKQTYKELHEIYQKAKKEGFIDTLPGVDGPCFEWSGKLYTYLKAIGNSFNIHPFSTIISTDIVSILRSSLYSITDEKLFRSPPSCERDVHERIEAVLRCVFPDLKNKPVISKPIKNFEPDTGLPSVRTLIEYKFISSKEDAKRISDEVLADTRGYFSRDWERFIYVIYETSRIKPEAEWNNMLLECGVPDNTTAVVLSG